MGSTCSLITVFCDQSQQTTSRLRAIFVRLSVIQILMGALDLVLYFVFPEAYKIWYWLVIAIAGAVLGAVGLFAAFQRSFFVSVLFGILYYLRIIGYLAVEYLFWKSGRTGNIIIAIVGVCLRLFVAILFSLFLRLWFKKIYNKTEVEAEEQERLLTPNSVINGV